MANLLLCFIECKTTSLLFPIFVVIFLTKHLLIYVCMTFLSSSYSWDLLLQIKPGLPCIVDIYYPIFAIMWTKRSVNDINPLHWEITRDRLWYSFMDFYE